MNTNPSAKRVLCFGDSYTRGYVPNSGHIRMPANIRRTGVLQDLLGKEFEIIEEGLNSRTLNSTDLRPGKEGRNGADYLIPCLETHDPIDLVILMLGTNESKMTFERSAEEIGHLLEQLFISTILHRKSQFRDSYPQLLLISPPYVDESKEYASKRYIGSKKKLIAMSEIYKTLAEKHNCFFINAGEIVTVGDDGVHLDESNQKLLAQKIYEYITTHIYPTT